MLIQVAEVESHGAPILLAIVPSEFTLPEAGPSMISRIARHRPTLPIMLISIEENGPRAFAYFHTHVLLALLQLETLTLVDLDLAGEISEPELPF